MRRQLFTERNADKLRAGDLVVTANTRRELRRYAKSGFPNGEVLYIAGEGERRIVTTALHGWRYAYLYSGEKR